MSIKKLRPASFLAVAFVLAIPLIPSKLADTGSMTLIGTLAAIERPAVRTARFSAGFLQRLISIPSLLSENARLKTDVADLKEQLNIEVAGSSEKSRRIEMLAEFMPYKQKLSVCEAAVIGEGAGIHSGYFFIDRGTRDNIRPGVGIVAGKSLIGVVRVSAAGASSVEAVANSTFKIDAELAETGERGIVAGNGDGTLRMLYVSKRRPRIGEGVLTRGRDGYIPRHFLIGTVTAAERKPGELTYDIIVSPVRSVSELSTVLAVIPAGADIAEANQRK